MIDLIKICKKVRNLIPDRIDLGNELNTLLRKNHELNYKLIKYIWWKNFHTKIKSNHSNQESNHGINLETLFWKVALELQNNEELKSKLDTLLNKIPAQSQKKHARESLKILYAYGALYYKHLNGGYQQDSVIDFVKRNLNTILNRGKLEKTKISTQEQCRKLIEKNKGVIDKLKECSNNSKQKISLETRKIIFKEIEQYVDRIHEREQVLQNTQNIQQAQSGINEIKDRLLKCINGILTRGTSLAELEEKAENLKNGAAEFENNTKRARRKITKANKKLFIAF